MGSFRVQVHDVVLLRADQSSESGHRSQIHVISKNKRNCSNAQRLAFWKKPSGGMGQKSIAMSLFFEVTHETQDLGLTTAPMLFRIDMEDLEPTPMTACGHGLLSSPTRSPKAWHT